MRRFTACFAMFLMLSASVWAMPVGTAARTVIPSDIQQIISVDYRALRNSETAMALKQRVLPDNVKQFETALRDVGIDPDRDLEQLTFVSFRAPKQGVKVIGIAQGQFPTKAVLKKMKLKKIVPKAYRSASVYPMSGMQMSFLDDFTLVFGEESALHFALDTRDGMTQTLDSNPSIADQITAVDSNPVWSVLDQQGTQNMMRSALGEASSLTDYEVIRKRLLASRYSMNFGSGVSFDLNVVTSDSITAATLSSLVQAGMVVRKMSASPIEKTALEQVNVESDGSDLHFKFRSDDKKFQSLLNSDLFAQVAR
jgi:hypothetical protein